MRFRTWPVAAFALAALLLLIVVSVLESNRRAQEIYSRLDDVDQRYHEVESKLRRLRSDVNMSGIFVRDYLLDPAGERTAAYRQQLRQFRGANNAAFDELRLLIEDRQENTQRLERLRAKLAEYWGVLDPLFDWTPSEKATQSVTFLRTEVIPRREAVLSIALEIEEINRSTMAAQRTEVAGQQKELQRDLYALLAWSLLLGGIVALTAVIRLGQLEKRSAKEQHLAEEAERRMRELSQQLVATQEEERKKLSRELHDHVGQVLTALRMELGSIDRLRAAGDGALARAVAESRQLVDNMVRTVRDLALGLRPSMLDDFGLQPALEWHAREFTRRYNLPVDLTISGELSQLVDPYATCIYRVVQEALTNCIRHAKASHIRVTVAGGIDTLAVAVVDNGVGINPESRRSGLGLRGIEERVRDLGGNVEIHTAPGVGTSLTIRIPMPQGNTSEEAPLARIAG
ncbi:MAG TPA: sensor histidine kinase [Vicinamibacterales bacterium]|nr:sensor histidine kinase [Vicinamibacterales bacterium]